MPIRLCWFSWIIIRDISQMSYSISLSEIDSIIYPRPKFIDNIDELLIKSPPLYHTAT